MVNNPFSAAKERYYLSESGLASLKHKLSDLRGQRVEHIEALKTIKGQTADGIYTEDSSYMQALSAIRYDEDEIEKVEHILAHAHVLSDQTQTDYVSLGSKVKLRGDGQEFEYTIVNSIEADPSQGKISDKSPLGKQLLGKRLRDYITLKNLRHNKRFSLKLVGIK